MPTADGADVTALPPALKRRVMEALEAPELHETPLPSGFTTLMRLWHYEELGTWRAWSISSRPSAIDASPLRIRKVVWDQPGELARLAEVSAPGAAELSPRLSLSEARFPAESWQVLLQEASALKVPPLLPEAGSPLEGPTERFGLEYRLLARTISFEWCEDPPAEWGELAKWAARVRGALETWLR
jgi:hypothetical protein